MARKGGIIARTQIYTKKNGESYTKIWDSHGKYVGEVETHESQIRTKRVKLVYKKGEDPHVRDQ